MKHRGLRINDEERVARFLEVVSFSVSPPTCDHFKPPVMTIDSLKLLPARW
jgi:hypothetical protein